MSFTLTPKRKKTLYILLAVVAGVGLAVGLALYALRQNLNLFYTPTQLVQQEAPEGRRIQVGGLVMQGSVQRAPDSLEVRFTITDLKHQVDVTYSGILPDLFREGQGIVANGRLENGVVKADEVLAKHDETYMPPQVKHAIEQAGHPAGK
ncbi:MAG: cytochrome biosis protein CcmE [Moraxellaceae bacterium]|jgi:cytochrome c-type biogenesis protein CcmE|nr:cytochrome biosis protein CcmE [Moraxellaceae bacterium]